MPVADSSRPIPPAAEKKWLETITPDNNLFSLNIREIWSYRDLLFILTRRDIVALYKQTILGPLWFVLQPILTTITFVIVFYRAARLKTMDLPPVLFYMSGLVLWSYFSECVVRTSTFFKDSSPILSKVYFPRLIVPLALIMTNLVRFSLQLALFFVIYLYYLFVVKTPIVPNAYALLLPVLVLMVALLGLGTGMIISSLTTRYKDLAHLTTFGVQLLMFASTVIFPLSSIGTGTYSLVIKANPMTGIIEAFRYAFLGKGQLNWALLGYDAGCLLFLMFLGIIVFNSIEKSFVDSI
jgi:lipopolysaccharide transport system permease protein